jgi:ParB-like chromosome segregation protein Spo0J
MTELPVGDLLANPLVGSVTHLDPERVANYAQHFEQLPPVVVFEAEDGLLLADGYHRVAAAQRRGITTIAAEIRAGTRQDALRYAAAVGARERGISVGEALAAIQRRSKPR